MLKCSREFDSFSIEHNLHIRTHIDEEQFEQWIVKFIYGGIAVESFSRDELIEQHKNSGCEPDGSDSNLNKLNVY